MLGNILSWLMKTTAVHPSYQAEHCLAVTRATGGCDACAHACPHHAISIKRMVEIDDIDCTGCGLCVHACPSQALSSSVSYQAGAALKCSKVKGGANTTVCLGRLQTSDIIALAGKRDAITLVHADCADCSIGTSEVLEQLEQSITSANALLELLGRTIIHNTDAHDNKAAEAAPLTEANTIQLNLLQREHFDAVDNPALLDRRELLRGGWRNMQSSAADALAPLERFAADDAHTDKQLPLEHQKKLHVLSLADLLPEEHVPFALPRVEEGCIMCPKCTQVCPTQAFAREFHEDSSQLTLRSERCNGCFACVTSCPKKVITLEDSVTWQELSDEAQVVFQRENQQEHTSVAR